MNPFGLTGHLETLAARATPRFTVAEVTADSFGTWQESFRTFLRERLVLARPEEMPAPESAVEQTRERDGFREVKHQLRAEEGVSIPVYELLPAQPKHARPVVVFHGHNPNVQYCLGNYPDEETAATMRAKDNNYAEALAQAGYRVFAVEQRGFGERWAGQTTDGGGNPMKHGCRELFFAYLARHRVLLGERVRDGMAVISWLNARNDIDISGLGVTGNSGGGTTALWLAALDERVTVAVPGSYFCSFAASIHGRWHCECNYVPGLLDLCEMGDLASLVAPRPLRFINGEEDPIFPIAGAREQFAVAQKGYALAGAPDRVDLHVHPGAHRYVHAPSHAWFDHWL